MGAGIAVEFKNRFGNVEYLKSQNAQIGQYAYLEYMNLNIFYLITKERYFDKPTLQDLQNSLWNMKNRILYNQNIRINKVLCIPKPQWFGIRAFRLGIRLWIR